MPRIPALRSPRSLLLAALAVLLPASIAPAEVLVLKDGRVYEVDGPVQRDGDLLILNWRGQKVSMLRLMVDEGKTAELNRMTVSAENAEGWNRAVERAMASPGRGAERSIALAVWPPPEEIKTVREPWNGEEENIAGEYPISAQRPRVTLRTRTKTNYYPESEEKRAPMVRERRAPSTPAPAPKPARTAPAPRPSAADQKHAASRERMVKIDQQLAEERKNLNALTDLKSNASQLVETDVRSLDTDIRRSQRRIDSLEAEKTRVEKDLQ